jgi:hypothetical protein
MALALVSILVYGGLLFGLRGRVRLLLVFVNWQNCAQKYVVVVSVSLQHTFESM